MMCRAFLISWITYGCLMLAPYTCLIGCIQNWWEVQGCLPLLQKMVANLRRWRPSRNYFVVSVFKTCWQLPSLKMRSTMMPAGWIGISEIDHCHHTQGVVKTLLLRGLAHLERMLTLEMAQQKLGFLTWSVASKTFSNLYWMNFTL